MPLLEALTLNSEQYLHPIVTQDGGCPNGALQCSDTGGATGDDSVAIREKNLGRRQFFQLSNLGTWAIALFGVLTLDIFVTLGGVAGVGALFVFALLGGQTAAADDDAA